MKSITVLALCLSCALFSFAQKHDKSVKPHLPPYNFKVKNTKSWPTVKLDSIVQNNSFKSEFVYDTVNLVVTQVEYYYDFNGWNPSQKTEYYLNAAGLITELSYYHYDFSQWSIFSKTEYQYDANDSVIEIIEHTTDWFTGIFGPYMKTELFYANQLLNHKLIYYYDNTVWQLSEKAEYSYNSNQKLLNTTFSFWDSNNTTWNVSWKTDYEYDMNSFLSLESVYYYDSFLNSWDPGSRMIYLNNPSGNILEFSAYSWNSIDSVWDGNEKREYTYYNPSQVASETQYLWDYQNLQWLGYNKNEYAYDAWGNRIEIRNSYWDDTNMQWYYNTKRERAYDINFPYSDLLVPYWYSVAYSSNHKISGEINYFWDGTQWQNADSVNFYYSLVIVNSLDVASNNAVTVFPSPASDFINIHLNAASCSTKACQFLLFDGAGRLVLAETFSENTLVNVSHLKKGYYSYLILLPDTSVRGKILKT